MTIYINDKQNNRFYRADVSMQWAQKHDNGAMISCGLTVGETVTPRSLNTLIRHGHAVEVSQEKWNHSGCQSRCILRGDTECRW